MMSCESYFGYIEKLGGNGWLRVKLNDGFTWPLPEFLKGLVTKSGDREEFEILEGRFKGKKASVKKKGGGGINGTGICLFLKMISVKVIHIEALQK